MTNLHEEPEITPSNKHIAAIRVARRLVRENDTGYEERDVIQWQPDVLFRFLEDMGYEWDSRGWTNAT